MYLLSLMWRRNFWSSYSAFSLTKSSSRWFCFVNFIWLWKSSFLRMIFQAGICLWLLTSVESLVKVFKMMLQVISLVKISPTKNRSYMYQLITCISWFAIPGLSSMGAGCVFAHFFGFTIIPSVFLWFQRAKCLGKNTT